MPHIFVSLLIGILIARFLAARLCLPRISASAGGRTVFTAEIVVSLAFGVLAGLQRNCGLFAVAVCFAIFAMRSKRTPPLDAA
jgi:hypothetical protein